MKNQQLKQKEISYVSLYSGDINGARLDVTKMLEGDELFIHIITYHRKMKSVQIEKVFNSDNEAVETAKKIMDLV